MEHLYKERRKVNCILAIYDNETEYANHLLDYMKRKQKKLTQVRVFTNHNSLREYSEQNQIYILLLNENIPAEEIKQDNIKNICILSEGNYNQEGSGYPVIYKFQSAESLMQELFSYYPLDTLQGKIKNSYEHQVDLISVFSIGEDAGRQAFALSLASRYAKLKKTLYINLDIFQAFTEFFGHNAEKGLSEFIYFLKQNHPNLINKMNGIIKKRGNLDYIQGVSFGPDLYELNVEDMLRWLEEIRVSTDYEVAIFDVGCYFQATLELFRNSGQVLLLLGENSREEDRYNNFKEQLSWACYEDVLEKITVVNVSNEQKVRYQNFHVNDLDTETVYSESASYSIQI